MKRRGEEDIIFSRDVDTATTRTCCLQKSFFSHNPLAFIYSNPVACLVNLVYKYRHHGRNQHQQKKECRRRNNISAAPHLLFLCGHRRNDGILHIFCRLHAQQTSTVAAGVAIPCQYEHSCRRSKSSRKRRRSGWSTGSHRPRHLTH